MKSHERFGLTDPLRPVGRTCVRAGRRTLVYFGGCDYFRLASHPAVLAAVGQGMRRHGLNVSASRLTTGNHPLYLKLEERLARFFGVERALVTGSGYAGNLVAAQALAHQVTCVLLDERAHASLADAAQLLGCRCLRFRHRDPQDLARLLATLSSRERPLILTDGLFAQDGSLAPLGDYLRLLPARGSILVDDAHGAGVLGRRGRGTAEFLGVSPQRLVQTVTLSKAFGVYGGVILGTESVAESVVARSRLFAGNTPLPLPLAAGALVALELLHTDPSLRTRLGQNTAYVKTTLRRAGLALADHPAPIVSWPAGHPAAKARLQARLLAAGIYPTLIRYPGGPKDGYFRFALSSEHTREQLDRLINALAG